MIAWGASVLLAATLTVPVFALHRELSRVTRMRVLAVVVTIPLVIGIFFAAAMSLVVLVDHLTRPRLAEGDDFMIMSVPYYPGIVIRLSLLATVPLTWLGLALWNRRKDGASPRGA
jgi:hypothetical protein